ncbi:MAG: ThuA domain-containing protein [Armatimonadetes bacterium]|nr:ThuA domain-containing protein [Armatimonadota bacterium]
MTDRKRALIVWGGWPGHEPERAADLFSTLLHEEGFATETDDTLDAFRDKSLADFDLLVPVWTMGTITPEQLNPVLEAVKNGAGIAGCHGGMGDAFRDSTEWQFLVGGQFVAHPGDEVTYRVEITDRDHEITRGLSDWEVTSEQYYMHVDPAIQVLATTRFPAERLPTGAVGMPVVWTKPYSQGRVFYCTLGHDRASIETEPARTLMKRGLLWAARR